MNSAKKYLNYLYRQSARDSGVSWLQEMGNELKFIFLVFIQSNLHQVREILLSRASYFQEQICFSATGTQKRLEVGRAQGAVLVLLSYLWGDIFLFHLHAFHHSIVMVTCSFFWHMYCFTIAFVMQTIAVNNQPSWIPDCYFESFLNLCLHLQGGETWNSWRENQPQKSCHDSPKYCTIGCPTISWRCHKGSRSYERSGSFQKQ